MSCLESCIRGLSRLPGRHVPGASESAWHILSRVDRDQLCLEYRAEVGGLGRGTGVVHSTVYTAGDQSNKLKMAERFCFTHAAARHDESQSDSWEVLLGDDADPRQQGIGALHRVLAGQDAGQQHVGRQPRPQPRSGSRPADARPASG